MNINDNLYSQHANLLTDTPSSDETALSSMTPDEAARLLQFLARQANMNLGDAESLMKRKEKERAVYLCHPFKITMSNGRWQTYVVDESTTEKKRKKIIKTNKNDLVDALYEFYGNPYKDAGKLTLKDLYPEWLEFKALHVSETYVLRIKTVWSKYYAGTEIVSIPVASFTKLQLDKWIHALIQQYELTKTEYFNMSLIIRQCLDYAVEKEILIENVFRKVHVDGRRVFRRTPKKPSRTQVFTDEEVKKLYDAAMDDYKHGKLLYELSPLAVIFMFQTGLRVSEVCAVRYEDVEDDRLHVQRMLQRDTRKVLVRTKGTFEDRYVFLTPESLKTIKLAKKRQWERGVSADGYIFSINGEPCSCSAIAHRFRTYCKRIGTVHKSSHKARKTFVSAALDGGINLNTVREAVGHQDERTTLQSYLYDRSGVERIKEQFANVVDRVHIS